MINRKPIIVTGPSIAYVPLTKGKFSLIDISDVEKAGQHVWFAKQIRSYWYAVRTQNCLSLHRHLLDNPNNLFVDHKNGDTLNNHRYLNIRVVTPTQNKQNLALNKRNTSGFKGVCQDNETSLWCARIQYNNKRIRLGFYKTPEEASMAYEIKAKELFGEFKRAL